MKMFRDDLTKKEHDGEPLHQFIVPLNDGIKLVVQVKEPECEGAESLRQADIHESTAADLTKKIQAALGVKHESAAKGKK